MSEGYRIIERGGKEPFNPPPPPKSQAEPPKPPSHSGRYSQGCEWCDGVGVRRVVDVTYEGVEFSGATNRCTLCNGTGVAEGVHAKETRKPAEAESEPNEGKPA